MLIRNKLILRFTLLVVGIQLCLSAFIYYFHAASREQRFANRLVGKASMTARLLGRPTGAAQEAPPPRPFRRQDLLTIPGERVSIYDAAQHLIYTSADGISQKRNSEQLDRIRPGRPVRFAEGPLETVGLQYEYRGRTYRIFASGLDAFGYRQLEKLRLILLVGNVGALALIILAGWYFADESLKPIARVVAQVERITAARLHTRVHEGNGTDEIARLAITFNRMLGGVEQAFESQKSFLAHASHELRTPLATVLGTLQTSAAYDTDLAEAKQSMHSAVEEITKLIALTNGLLSLAKADDASARREPVHLDACLTQAMTYCEAKHPGRSVGLATSWLPATKAPLFVVRGDAQLLTTALFNLLDNACKYSAGAVQVTIGYDTASTLVLTVADGGIGISAHELSHVLEPLYRAENGKNRPGYGLGLAITQKVIRLHGGNLTLTSTAGVGTEARVALPAEWV